MNFQLQCVICVHSIYFFVKNDKMHAHLYLLLYSFSRPCFPMVYIISFLIRVFRSSLHTQDAAIKEPNPQKESQASERQAWRLPLRTKGKGPALN